MSHQSSSSSSPLTIADVAKFMSDLKPYRKGPQKSSRLRVWIVERNLTLDDYFALCYLLLPRALVAQTQLHDKMISARDRCDLAREILALSSFESCISTHPVLGEEQGNMRILLGALDRTLLQVWYDRGSMGAVMEVVEEKWEALHSDIVAEGELLKERWEKRQAAVLPQKRVVRSTGLKLMEPNLYLEAEADQNRSSFVRSVRQNVLDVAHDVSEAITLANKLYFEDAGGIVQSGGSILERRVACLLCMMCGHIDLVPSFQYAYSNSSDQWGVFLSAVRLEMMSFTSSLPPPSRASDLYRTACELEPNISRYFGLVPAKLSKLKLSNDDEPLSLFWGISKCGADPRQAHQACCKVILYFLLHEVVIGAPVGAAPLSTLSESDVKQFRENDCVVLPGLMPMPWAASINWFYSQVGLKRSSPHDPVARLVMGVFAGVVDVFTSCGSRGIETVFVRAVEGETESAGLCQWSGSAGGAAGSGETALLLHTEGTRQFRYFSATRKDDAGCQTLEEICPGSAVLYYVEDVLPVVASKRDKACGSCAFIQTHYVMT